MFYICFALLFFFFYVRYAIYLVLFYFILYLTFFDRIFSFLVYYKLKWNLFYFCVSKLKYNWHRMTKHKSSLINAENNIKPIYIFYLLLNKFQLFIYVHFKDFSFKIKRLHIYVFIVVECIFIFIFDAYVWLFPILLCHRLDSIIYCFCFL